MNIFPVTELTKTEEDILAELYSNPTVVKHLHMLAYNIGSDVVTAIPESNESSETWMRRQCFMKGQIATVETLLSISENNRSKSNQG